MSQPATCGKYDELYKKYKRIIDKADNPVISVKHYADKLHCSKCKLDIENAIYIENGVHKFRIGGVI